MLGWDTIKAREGKRKNISKGDKNTMDYETYEVQESNTERVKVLEQKVRVLEDKIGRLENLIGSLKERLTNVTIKANEKKYRR